MTLPHTLGFLWALPLFIVFWLFYVFPLWALGHIRYDGREDPLVWRFRVVNRTSWYRRLWGGWKGHAGPSFIVMTPDFDAKRSLRTRLHELEHVRQIFRWGIFFYPVYVAIAVWIFWIDSPDKHPYFDHPFEMEARKAAGQPVQVDWKSRDVGDRWPWW